MLFYEDVLCVFYSFFIGRLSKMISCNSSQCNIQQVSNYCALDKSLFDRVGWVCIVLTYNKNARFIFFFLPNGTCEMYIKYKNVPTYIIAVITDKCTDTVKKIITNIIIYISIHYYTYINIFR